MLRLTQVSVVVSLAVAATAQQPEAVFDAPVVQIPSDTPPFQKLFDIDGDGDMDAVGGRVRSDGMAYEVRVWRNQQGRYVQALADVQNAVAGTPDIMAIAVGDLDHDGDADFVVGTGLAFYLYSNDNGAWARTVTSTTDKVGALGAGDFDGDGWTDVAVFTKGQTTQPGQLQVRLAQGPILTTPTPWNVQLFAHIITFDRDGNGTREIGLWDETNNQLNVFAVAGASVALQQMIAAAGAQLTSRSFWAEGDVDGDQDIDIVAFEWPPQPAPARLHCFRNSGAGAFTPEAAYHGGPARFLRDVDGDGDLDGVCCGGGTGGSSGTWPMLDGASTYLIALNDGQGHLAAAFKMAGVGWSWMAGVTDVDGDGRPDIVAGRAVYYGRGTLNESLSPAAAALDPVSASGVYKLADQLGDFDRDGDPDFVSTLEQQGNNDGSGAFVLRWGAIASALPAAGFIAGHPRFRGDFDGDGAADFVVPLSTAGGFSHMELVRNNGSGVLAAAGPAAPPGVRIGWLAWASVTDNPGFGADLDGDGDVDLVATADPNDPTYRSEIWWNQGNGTFVAGPTFATERIEAVADFDGDARPDLLTRVYSGPVQIRLGNATQPALFGPPMAALPQQQLVGIGALRVVDANDDGRLDILARRTAPNWQVQHEIFCNTTTSAGAATFQLAPGLLPPAEGVAVLADVDNDGRSDLIQQSEVGFKFATRIRRRIGGDGQVLNASHFAPPIDQVIWDGFPADVDADGDVDLIGTRVVRNMLRHGATAGLRRQYGDGTPGEAGVAPLLGIGPTVREGGVTNLCLSGVTGPTIGVFAISLLPASLPQVPLPGVTCLVDPALAVIGTWVLPAQGAGAARGAATLPIFLPPGLQGFETYNQVFVLDPAAPSWLAASNGLRTRFGG